MKECERNGASSECERSEVSQAGCSRLRQDSGGPPEL
jgi:hypothetical protein